MLAKYRLMQKGVDVSPNDPLNPQFRFGVTDITEFGNVKMQWRNLNWNCVENEVVQALNAFSRPLFSPDSVLARQLKDLETIHHPEDAAKEAQDLSNKLKTREPVKNEPDWFYFLCNASEANISLDKRIWTPLRKQPNDIKMMKRLSKEQSKWAIIVRVSRPRFFNHRSVFSADKLWVPQPWQLRHHKLCLQIFNLQQRQMEYCRELDKVAAHEAARHRAEGEEPCFNEG